jgi:hypothetical protein
MHRQGRQANRALRYATFQIAQSMGLKANFVNGNTCCAFAIEAQRCEGSHALKAFVFQSRPGLKAASMLYKYLRADYAMQAIETKRLKVSHPDDLNDIYDCRAKTRHSLPSHKYRVRSEGNFLPPP